MINEAQVSDASATMSISQRSLLPSDCWPRSGTRTARRLVDALVKAIAEHDKKLCGRNRSSPA